MKFTQRRIEDLERPVARKDALVFDDEQVGLGVRVTKAAQKGALSGKFYLIQYRRAGEKRRISLGPCSAISLADARTATRAALGEVAKGGDPAGERKRKAAHDALTFEALIEQWQALYLTGKRERYRAEAIRALRYAFADDLKTPAAELSRATVVRVLDNLAKDGKSAMASRTAAYGRACCQWGIKRGSIEANPFSSVPTVSVVKRERVLSDEELVLIWKATEGPGSFNGIARLLILTGQRREEAGSMAWSEVDAGLTTWTIPSSRAKNGVEHIVPLSAQTRALLREQPRREGTGLVFPGQRGAFSGWSKAKGELDKASGVRDWRLHDLRRSCVTGLQRLGVRFEVAEAVLNHISGSRGGVAGVYLRHTWADEKRRALELWGAHVAALVEGREPEAKVAPFRARVASQ